MYCEMIITIREWGFLIYIYHSLAQINAVSCLAKTVSSKPTPECSDGAQRGRQIETLLGRHLVVSLCGLGSERGAHLEEKDFHLSHELRHPTGSRAEL